MIRMRHIFWVFIFLGVGVYGLALALEHIGRFFPCHLCVYERWVYLIIAALALIGLFSTYLKGGSFSLLSLSLYVTILVTLGIGWLISLFHIGLEHRWWSSEAGCRKLSFAGKTLESIKQELLSRPFVPCNQPSLKLYGLSLTELNFLFLTFLLVVGIYWFRKVQYANRSIIPPSH